MKIGIFSPYFDAMTGGEKYMLTIASCLSKEHKIDLFWNDGSIVEKAESKFGLDLSGVRIRPNIFDSTFGFLKRQKTSFGYDLIIFLSDGSVPIVSSKKLLVHFQFPVEWVDEKSLKNKIKKLRISSVVCNSYFTKKYIDQKFGFESDVLYPPVDFVNSGRKKENIILTVGRFDKLSNGTDFKKLKKMEIAFKELKEKESDSWKLIIVTNVNANQKKEFLEFRKSISSSSVEVLEDISRKQIFDLYSVSKIYWHAAGFGEDLDKHPERAEHFGISAVEAMSAGSVPVVFNAGGLREVIKNGENGLMWEELDELIDKTREIINDDKLWSKLSAGAMKRSLDFGKERFCEELRHIINL